MGFEAFLRVQLSAHWLRPKRPFTGVPELRARNPKNVSKESFGGSAKSLAFPIALYRPQMGPPARNGKKNGPKNGFWPHQEIGPKMGQKWPFSHFSAILSSFSGGAKINFGPFPHFRPEARFGAVQGNRDRKKSPQK